MPLFVAIIKQYTTRITIFFTNICHLCLVLKVEDFIAHVCRTSQHGFSYEDVMVVCNKCDVIPEEQLDDAKINARDQLLKTCPELKDDQIAFLSVKEVMSLHRSRSVTETSQ